MFRIAFRSQGDLFQRVPWHVGKERILRVLHNGFSAALLNFPEACSPVVKGTRENNSNHSGPIRTGRGTKQGIDGGAVPIFLWPRVELNAVLMDEQVMVRARAAKKSLFIKEADLVATLIAVDYRKDAADTRLYSSESGTACRLFLSWYYSLGGSPIDISS